MHWKPLSISLLEVGVLHGVRDRTGKVFLVEHEFHIITDNKDHSIHATAFLFGLVHKEMREYGNFDAVVETTDGAGDFKQRSVFAHIDMAVEVGGLQRDVNQTLAGMGKGSNDRKGGLFKAQIAIVQRQADKADNNGGAQRSHNAATLADHIRSQTTFLVPFTSPRGHQVIRHLIVVVPEDFPDKGMCVTAIDPLPETRSHFNFITPKEVRPAAVVAMELYVGAGTSTVNYRRSSCECQPC
jgi:hypothetical protein